MRCPLPHIFRNENTYKTLFIAHGIRNKTYPLGENSFPLTVIQFGECIHDSVAVRQLSVSVWAVSFAIFGVLVCVGKYVFFF